MDLQTAVEMACAITDKAERVAFLYKVANEAGVTDKAEKVAFLYKVADEVGIDAFVDDYHEPFEALDRLGFLIKRHLKGFAAKDPKGARQWAVEYLGKLEKIVEGHRPPCT